MASLYTGSFSESYSYYPPVKRAAESSTKTSHQSPLTQPVTSTAEGSKTSIQWDIRRIVESAEEPGQVRSHGIYIYMQLNALKRSIMM